MKEKLATGRQKQMRKTAPSQYPGKTITVKAGTKAAVSLAEKNGIGKIIIRENASAEITEVASTEGRGATSDTPPNAIHFELGKNARLEYWRMGTESKARRLFVIGEGAAAFTTVASFNGGALELEARLAGKKAKMAHRSAFFGKNGEQFSFTTKVFHEAENTESSLLTKGALGGKATASNESEVRISKNAGGSSSALREKDIQLDEGVASTSTPAMFIENSTSSATHGATVSKIAEESLFYIRTRGVGLEEAERLVLEGFFAEIADSMPEGLRKEFWEKIGGMAGVENGC